MLGPAGIVVAAGSPGGRHVPGPSAGLTALQRRVSGTTDDGVPQRRQRTAARLPRRQVAKRAGLALLYTVQPGDTLTLIAERLYGDWRQDTRILRASQTTVQPDGRRLTNPNRIYPGWTLRAPLPVPAVSVVGEHAVYIVQPGDTLSQIAARFLGDWRRYSEIDRLSRDVRQPDGEILEDDNLIQPGWVLRLPAAQVIAPYTRPAQLTRLRPRPAARRHRAAALHNARAVGSVARTHDVGSPAQGRTQPPVCGVVSRVPVPTPQKVPVALPRQAAVHRAHQGASPRQIHAHPVRPMSRLRPKRHGHLRLSVHHPRRLTARRHVAATHAVTPGQVLAPAATHREGVQPAIGARRPRAGTHPVVYLPGSGRTLPLTLAVAVLALCSMAALKMKRGA
jgi:LysM repeat protein